MDACLLIASICLRGQGFLFFGSSTFFLPREVIYLLVSKPFAAQRLTDISVALGCRRAASLLLRLLMQFFRLPCSVVLPAPTGSTFVIHTAGTLQGRGSHFFALLRLTLLRPVLLFLHDTAMRPTSISVALGCWLAVLLLCARWLAW